MGTKKTADASLPAWSPDKDTLVIEDDAPPSPSDTAKPKPPLKADLKAAREKFINQCLLDWGKEQWAQDRGCDPGPGHVDKLVAKAGRLFDALFTRRPLTSNLV